MNSITLTDQLTDQTAAQLRRLAAARFQVRTRSRVAGSHLNWEDWLRFNYEAGPFPNPTALWGLGDDRFPVILELNVSTAGAIVVMSDYHAWQKSLLTAVLLSIASQNDPSVVAIHVVTSTTPAWEWTDAVPHVAGMSRPGDDGLLRALHDAYVGNYYLVVFADGDRAAMTLPKKLLQEGPQIGLWPLVFCSPQTGLQMVAAAQPLVWSPVMGARCTPLDTNAHPLVQSALPPTPSRPGLWTYRQHEANRVVTFGIPPIVNTRRYRGTSMPIAPAGRNDLIFGGVPGAKTKLAFP